MKRAAWIAAIVVGALALTVVGVYLAGATLEREHRTSVTRTLPVPPAELFAVIVDVEAAPTWRELDGVELLEREPLRWRERGEYGELTFVEVRRVPDRLFEARIEDTGDMVFGGTWTYTLEPVAEGTQLTITERGWIESPLFRALTRWGWGYDATIRAYLDQLAAHLGEP